MNNEQFYPTPETLLEKIFADMDFGCLHTVLEPSAGNGDIVDFLLKKADSYPYYNRHLNIDCVEINPTRQATLKGKEYKVVYDDFLTFKTYKKYDLIVMNPPFNEGCRHLLHALEMQKNGGSIICILNAETVKNLCTNERGLLSRKLKELNADIEYYEEEFVNAEVPAKVEIAVIKVIIPEAENVSYIFEELKKAPKYAECETKESTDLTINDIVESAILQYELEIEAGIKLMQECAAMGPMILNSFDDSKWNSPILSVKVFDHDASVNKYVKAVRAKYWGHLFKNPKFTKGMTSAMQDAYLRKVDELSEYDFNKFNIKTIQAEMSRHMVNGVEKCIIDLFDSFTYHYSTENAENIHYFNGWKTNKAWICRKKVILPLYDAFDNIFHKFSYRWSVSRKLLDVEKVFDFLAGRTTDDSSLIHILDVAEQNQDSRNIEFKYFTCTFYKKGTCHLTFKDEELLKKFNIFGAQHKGWLPPAYGKKGYDDLDMEEKSVIDSFEGEKAYRDVCNKPGFYLFEPKNAISDLNRLLPCA